MKGWFARVLDSLNEDPANRPRAPRKSIRDLHANYFTGGDERPYRVANVSLTGALIESPAQWAAGTLVVILFQVDPPHEGAPVSTIPVQARVARWTPEGFGVEFIFKDKAQRRDFERFLKDHQA